MLIGRDSEMGQVTQLLRTHKQALVVVSSKPKMGRSTFLEEIRRYAANQNWRVLSSISDSKETSQLRIEINRDTTKNDFLSTVSSSLAAGIDSDDAHIQITLPSAASFVPEGATTGREAKGGSSVSAQAGALQPSGNQQDAPSADAATSASGKSQ